MEAVVTGRNGCMRCENALPPNSRKIVFGGLPAAASLDVSLDQREP